MREKGAGVSPALELWESIGSTNDRALELGREGAPHGSAVAARCQTSGRGRRGHVWESPRGNLYLSIVLRPRVAPSRLPGLAAACGLGAADALDVLLASNAPQLKWPNDLLADGRKLGGILVEAARDCDGKTFAVCGIGINIESVPCDLEAVSLAELGAATSFSALAEALQAGIVLRVDTWASAEGERPLDGIQGDYLARLAWRGEKVAALSPTGDELSRGTLETIDPWGRAVLGTSAGTRSFSAEQASLRPLSD